MFTLGHRVTMEGVGKEFVFKQKGGYFQKLELWIIVQSVECKIKILRQSWAWYFGTFQSLKKVSIYHKSSGTQYLAQKLSIKVSSWVAEWLRIVRN